MTLLIELTCLHIAGVTNPLAYLGTLALWSIHLFWHSK